ncbi:glycosyltransferase [Luteolibacter sp. GHJ8]|uniref:Glycosyltransferase n=1 Tax=Luteolibacter rhizosphaerae TaxID=2989719 RepID=A0ABT3G3R1_9BACT|nr:glycosyltransferase [Luteolibacter rhizosphaerae]MCW1914129.1 glycosyltransferase [Luteolibacter rhizosphaerae]
MPKISIVMPFRNSAATLPEALASVRAQTFRDWELLAVDDRSTDDSAAIVAAVAAGDGRVTLLANKSSRGVVGASETAGWSAKGAWLARMDSDDISHPERLAWQWRMTEERPELDVIGCGVEILTPLGDGMARHVDWVNSLQGSREIANARFIENPLVHPSALMRKSAIAKAGGYREVPWAEDHDLWLRLLEGGSIFGKVSETLLQWRDSPGRLTRNDPRYGDTFRNKMRAHFLARMTRVKESGVVVAGAGPIGKAIAQELLMRGIAVKGFFEVHPRRIGEKIHGAEVKGLDEFGQQWREAVLLSAVGVPGAREDISRMALEQGREDGVDFWALC